MTEINAGMVKEGDAMDVRRNNQGLTLVELVLAMAMSSIILSAVTYFMFVGSKSFQYSQAESTVQAEQQIIMNQIVERTYLFSNADVLEEGSSKYFRIFNLDEFGNPSEGNTFWLDLEDGSNKYKFYVFDEYVEDADLSSLDSRRDIGFLGNYVKDIEADVKNYSRGKALHVTLTVEKNGRQHKSSNLIRFRNQ